MEFLINFVLFINLGQAQELERFQKRISGFESYQKHWEELEEKRLSAADQQRKQRQKQIEIYEKTRDSFQRPQPKITEEMDRAHEQQKAQREQRALEKQYEYAQKKLRTRLAIEQEASRIEPREYRLEEVR